jgi:hypothetical protein
MGWPTAWRRVFITAPNVAVHPLASKETALRGGNCTRHPGSPYMPFFHWYCAVARLSSEHANRSSGVNWRQR